MKRITLNTFRRADFAHQTMLQAVTGRTWERLTLHAMPEPERVPPALDRKVKVVAEVAGSRLVAVTR